MTTPSTVLSGSDLESPSGLEVESAAFHQPVGLRGVRARVGRMRSRGARKAHDLQHRIADRTRIAQSSIRHSMQTNPVKWVVIAAGAGFGLGLLGRFVQWRSHRNVKPELILVEA